MAAKESSVVASSSSLLRPQWHLKPGPVLDGHHAIIEVHLDVQGFGG